MALAFRCADCVRLAATLIVDDDQVSSVKVEEMGREKSQKTDKTNTYQSLLIQTNAENNKNTRTHRQASQ